MTHVRKDFPVWRELKRVNLDIHRILCDVFVRKDFPVWRELKRQDSLNSAANSEFRPKGLSRLKGIETEMSFADKKFNTALVRKDFPVWRELKHLHDQLLGPLTYS